MNPFEILVANLNGLGFFGFLLPWMFVFVVVFALLLKTKALGDNTKIIGVLSLVIAFFTIGYGGPAMASFFVNIFGLATMVIAGIIVIILFLALTGTDITKVLGSKAGIAVLVGVGIVIFVTVLGAVGSVTISDSVIGIIFIIIVMAVAILFVTKS